MPSPNNIPHFILARINYASFDVFLSHNCKIQVVVFREPLQLIWHPFEQPHNKWHFDGTMNKDDTAAIKFLEGLGYPMPYL